MFMLNYNKHYVSNETLFDSLRGAMNSKKINEYTYIKTMSVQYNIYIHKHNRRANFTIEIT